MSPTLPVPSVVVADSVSLNEASIRRSQSDAPICPSTQVRAGFGFRCGLFALGVEEVAVHPPPGIFASSCRKRICRSGGLPSAQRTQLTCSKCRLSSVSPPCIATKAKGRRVLAISLTNVDKEIRSWPRLSRLALRRACRLTLTRATSILLSVPTISRTSSRSGNSTPSPYMGSTVRDAIEDYQGAIIEPIS